VHICMLHISQSHPGMGAKAPWGLPEFSTSLAASLQVIDASGCLGLDSVNAVRSCVHLRCLRLAGGLLVSDLSPLAACSQLEELFMAGNDKVTSLAPLKACPNLRKLDLRDCSFPNDEDEDSEDLGEDDVDPVVANLQLSCTQLADPSSVMLEGLVHNLQPHLPPDMQQGAAGLLRFMASGLQGFMAFFNPGADLNLGKANIAAAGAIPPLVQLLRQHACASAGVQKAAADVLNIMAADSADNQSAITAAGAVPLLVRLRGQEPDEYDYDSPDVRPAAGNLLRLLGVGAQ
jgi:hypothetical protein